MAEGLKIKIGADVAQGVAGVNQFNKAISQVKPGANQATLAMVNLGRVVQDAPYGFIGIANNINPLLESFQRLRAASGSTGSALKTFASSLLGAGGIGLVVSLVSTGLLLFGDRLFGTGQKSKKAKEETDALTKALERQKEIIEQSAQAVAKEAAQVDVLVSQVKSGNLSRKETVSVIEQLKKIAPEYFNKLDTEKAKIEDIVAAYGNYNLAMIKMLESKIKMAQLEDTISKRLQLQNDLIGKGFISAIDNPKLGKFSNSLESIRRTLEEFPNAKVENLFPRGLRDQGGVQRLAKLLKEELSLTKQIAEVTPPPVGKTGKDKETELEKEIKRIKEQIAALENLKKTAGLLKKEEFELVELKVKLAIDENINSGDLNPEQLQRQIDSIINAADVHADVPLRVVEERKINVDLGKASGTPSLKAAIDEAGGLAKKQGEINKNFIDMQKLAADTSEFLTTQLGGAFTNFFDDLLSGGRNALADFSKMLGAIIRKLIAAAITAAIFAAIIGAVSGGSNFGQAAGQTSNFASGFKNIFSGLGGFSFAKGGVVTKPTLAMVGDNPSGKEAIIPFERLGQFANMMGGGNGYIAETTIRGQDLVVLLKKATNNANRIL